MGTVSVKTVLHLTMSAIIDCASGGLDESDEASDCSNASK